MREILGYTVTDKNTGQVVKEYGPGKRRAADRYADRKDIEYGAIRYIVRPILS